MSSVNPTATQIRAEKKTAARAEIVKKRRIAADEDFGYEVTERRGGSIRVTFEYRPWDPFDALMMLQALRSRCLDSVELSMVAAARREGISWDDIGFALEVTGDAVRKRWGESVSAVLAELNQRDREAGLLPRRRQRQ